MRIQSIEDSKQTPVMKAGLYFSKRSKVLYNQDANLKYATDELVSISQDGIRYIEDKAIPQEIKDKFVNIPFLNKLAKNFDTFVFFLELPKNHKYNFLHEYLAHAEISWADSIEKCMQRRKVSGTSPISLELATKKMFKNLEKHNFDKIT